jgi:hypothetical protein
MSPSASPWFKAAPSVPGNLRVAEDKANIPDPEVHLTPQQSVSSA